MLKQSEDENLTNLIKKKFKNTLKIKILVLQSCWKTKSFELKIALTDQIRRFSNFVQKIIRGYKYDRYIGNLVLICLFME